MTDTDLKNLSFLRNRSRMKIKIWRSRLVEDYETFEDQNRENQILVKTTEYYIYRNNGCRGTSLRFIVEFNWSKSKVVQRASDASAFVKRFWRGLFHGSPIHGKKYLCVLLRRQEGDLFNNSTRSFLNNKSVPRSFRVERINHRFDDPLKTLWKKDNKKGSYYSEGETKSRRETEENCWQLQTTYLNDKTLSA